MHQAATRVATRDRAGWCARSRCRRPAPRPRRSAPPTTARGPRPAEPRPRETAETASAAAPRCARRAGRARTSLFEYPLPLGFERAHALLKLGHLIHLHEALDLPGDVVG